MRSKSSKLSARYIFVCKPSIFMPQTFFFLLKGGKRKESEILEITHDDDDALNCLSESLSLE